MDTASVASNLRAPAQTVEDDGPRAEAAATSAAQPIASRAISFGELAVLTLQIGLLVASAYLFEVESVAFRQVMLLGAAAFVVHAVLPRPRRLPFFCLVSIAGFFLVLGPALGALVCGIGLAFVGACLAPRRYGIVILVVGGLFAAVVRAGYVTWTPLAIVVPILASMFMFRTVVFLHDLRTTTKRPSTWEAIAYFFLLPNVCMPLFPVVDFKTAQRKYYDERDAIIYQRSVGLMLSGIVQLLLYRAVRHYVLLNEEHVVTFVDRLRFLVGDYLLYVRVSGQFHLAMGLIGLFGFNLPRTHHRYFLASSFADMWRRINVYWTTFMQKLVFYPVSFRTRKLGMSTSIVLSTSAVIVTTWLLHSYQTFWLTGTFPIRIQDILFWGIVGVLLIVTALWEQRHGRRRSLTPRRWSFGRAITTTLKTAATFVTMAVLWSLWSSESLSDWFHTVAR